MVVVNGSGYSRGVALQKVVVRYAWALQYKDEIQRIIVRGCVGLVCCWVVVSAARKGVESEVVKR